MSRNNNSSSGGGIGFTGLLAILFIALKLIGGHRLALDLGIISTLDRLSSYIHPSRNLGIN